MSEQEQLTDLVSRIMKKSNLSEDEVTRLIQKRQEEFEGMLSIEGAAYSVARDFEVVADAGAFFGKKMLLGQLKTGMEGVSVEGVIQRVFEPRPFEKNNRMGKVASVIIGDDTGEARVTLWNNDVRLVEDGVLVPGTRVVFRKCNVSEWKGQKQVSIARNGKIEVTGTQEAQLLERAGREELTKASQLREDAPSVSIKAKIVKVFEPKTFDSNGRKGSVCNVLAADETGTLRLTFWGETVERARQLRAGDIVLVSNAYTKKPFNGKLDLNVGSKTFIAVIPLETAPKELLELKQQGSERKKIRDLTEPMERVEVSGIITKVVSLRAFDACAKCGGKYSEGKCTKCGNPVSVKRPVMNFELEDGSEGILVTAFGNASQQLFKANFSKDGEELLEEARKELTGKNVLLEGRTSFDEYREAITMVCNDVKRLDYREEAKELMHGTAS